MIKCTCKGKLEETKELVFYKGKSVVANVKKCKGCGMSFFSPDEVERIRLELNPTLWERIERLFRGKQYDRKESPFIVEGRIL